MSKMYSDPTASAAIGSLDKELERMKKTAKELREKRRAGKLTPEAQQRARTRFPTGMVRRLFDTAMNAPEEQEEESAGCEEERGGAPLSLKFVDISTGKG